MRGVLSDHLQNHSFWLADTGPLDLAGLPALSPSAGFSSITAPSIELDMHSFTEGNFGARSAVKTSKIGEITLSRGITLGDSDFYKWIQAARFGQLGGRILSGVRQVGGIPVSVRRNLLLIQFFPRKIGRAHV